MNKNYFQNNPITKTTKLICSLLLLAVFFISNTSNAQTVTVTGATNVTPNLSTTYANLAAAITAINSASITAISGPVVFTCSGNETAPAGGFVINQADFANTITIDGAGSVITAPSTQTIGSINDAIFKIIGTDNVTIQNFTMQENSSNTTTGGAAPSNVTTGNNMTEFGVALFYKTTTNGAQNVKIKNNTISLNKTYQNTFGIYANATHTATSMTGSATATGTLGGNSGLQITGNTISFVNLGVVVIGPLAAADHNNNVIIGGTAANSNIIASYGYTTTNLSGYVNMSGSLFGVLVRNSVNYDVSYNTITSNANATAGTLRGIYVPAFSNAPTIASAVNKINNNTLSITSAFSGAVTCIQVEATTGNATTDLNINDNKFKSCGYSVAASAAFTCISNAAVVNNLYIKNNLFGNLNINTTGNGNIISNNSASTNSTIDGNKICGITAGVPDGAVSGTFTKSANNTVNGYISSATFVAGTTTITNNNFSNVTLSGTATFYGIRVYPAVANILQTANIYNNTITNITGGSTATMGISFGGGSATSTVYSNIVGNISGSSTAVNGIQLGDSFVGAGLACYKNKVYGISGTSASSVVSGIYVALGATTTIYNNIIGNLTSPTFTAAAYPYLGVSGINLNGGTTNNLYNNTVYLASGNTSSGANFASNCIYSTATPTTVLMQNNLLVNLNTATGSGKAVAFQRSAAALTNYAAASNNNNLYGTNGLYWDGTTAYTVLGPVGTAGTYKYVMNNSNAGKESAALSQSPTFLSNSFTAPSLPASNYLHIDGTVPTPIESGGMTVATANPDIDGDNRPGPTATNGGGTAFDVGADEYDGLPGTPSISYSAIAPTGSNCTTNVDRNVTVTVSPLNSLSTNPVLTYYYNGIAQSPITMTAGTGTLSTSGTWTATIPSATAPAATLVTWEVYATDGTLSKTWQATAYSYKDNSTSGITGTATTSVASLCPNGTTTLSATFVSSLTAPTSYGSSPTATAGNDDIGEVKLQVTSGLTTVFDNISTAASLVGNIGTASGTAGVFANYTSFGPYNVTAGTNYTCTITGIGSTGSNNGMAIFIDYNKNGLFTDSGELVYSSTAATAGSHSENTSFTIPASAVGGTTRMRVILLEGSVPTVANLTSLGSYGEVEDYMLKIAPTFSSYSWNQGSAGGTQVGTSNTVTLTGTAQPTTYYLTATDAYSCTVVSSVTITGSGAMANNGITSTNGNSLCYGLTPSTVLGKTVTGGCSPFTYTWSCPGATASFSSTSSPTPTFTATASGPYTITCVISDSSGGLNPNVSSTYTITVNNPQAVPSPSTYTNCGTNTFSLTATASSGANILNWYNVASGGASLGTGSPFVTAPISASTTYYVEEGVGGPATGTTGSGSVSITGTGLTPFSGLFEGQHTQYLVTATDLTAAGLTSGNLTALSLILAKASTHSLGYVGYTIKIGSAGSTSTLTSLLSPTFTTVYGPTNYTTVNGVNTFTFTSSYNWNGTDNLVIDVCYSNDPTNSTGSGTSWSSNDNATGTTKTGTVVYGYFQDNSTMCGATTGTQVSSSVLPNFTFSGQSITCRGSRVPVTLNVSSANPLTITSNQTVCNDTYAALTVTSTLANFSSYTWSPTTNLYTNTSGNPYTGGSATTVYVKTATAGSQTYTCTGNPCTNTATSTVTTMPVPTISSSTSTICTSGTPTLSLSPSTGYTGGSIQWQSSSTGVGGSYSNISGATAATYTPAAPITATTYYQVILKDSAGGSCATIAPITITVNNPTIATTTGATRCGTGTVNLAATGSAGSTLNWYAASSGGASLGTGSPFTTPSISATTNYYVSAGYSQTYSNLGNTSTPTSSGWTNQRGIVFTATQSGTIVSAQYYSTTLNVTNSFNVVLVDNASGTTLNTVSLSVAQGATAGFYTMNLNFPVTAGTTYRLLAGAFSSGVSRIDSGVDYSLPAFNNLSPLGTITSGYDGGVTTTIYPYFHNIVVTAQCESARTAVLATVTTPPVLTLSNSSASICAGQTTPTVTASVAGAGGTSQYDTYTWSPSGATGSVATGWTFSPSATQTYTLTATQTSGGTPCTTTATYTVTVNASPSAVSITTPASGAASICVGSPAVQITAAGGAYSNTILSENFNGAVTGWTTTNNSTGGTPANAAWQYLADGSSITTVTTSTVIHSNDNSRFAVSDSDTQGSGSTTATILTSPNFNLAGYTSASLNFYHFFKTSDSGKVQITTNGSTWTDLATYTTTQGAATAFASVTINLDSYVGNSAVAIRFKYDATWDWNWAIDNVSITGTGSIITWSPTTNLYCDAAATVAYPNASYPNPLTVYAKPTLTTTYTATSTVPSSGCSKTATCIISTGNTVWNGTTWSQGAPAPGLGIEFQGNYTGAALSGCSCTVTSGNINITSGMMVLDNNISVASGASITFEDSTSLIQTNSAIANTGNITYKRKTSPIVNQYDFVYWGSPVAGQQLKNMWMVGDNENDLYYSFNTNATTGLHGGEDWVNENPNNVMTAGVGYIAREYNGYGFTAGTGNRYTSSFIGVPNNGNISVPIYKNGLDSANIPNIDNLLSNPYPAAIDIFAFQNDPTNGVTDGFGVTHPYLTSNYYFWSHFTPYGYIPVQQYWYDSGDYALFQATIGAGVGTAPSTNAGTFVPDRYFEAGQAFFAEASSYASNTGTSVVFKNAHRTVVPANQNTNFYKNSNKNSTSDFLPSDKIWLNVDSYHGAFKQLLIAYTQTATNDYDEYLDAKSLDGNSYIDFYSVVPNYKFVIQSRPTFTDKDMVPLGFKSAVAGNFEISIDHSDGLFATGQKVYLQDNVLNIDHELTASPYKFDTEIGSFDDRFILKYSSYLSNPPADGILIANNKPNLNIRSLTDNIKNITIFDLLGRLLYEKDEVHTKNFVESNLQIATQSLVVKITLENGEIITKKIIYK